MPKITRRPLRAAESNPRRRERFALREFLWRFSTLKRVRQCGRLPHSYESGVQLRLADGVAHYANLRTCGSVHSCPVCQPKIATRRATEIEQAARRHLAVGGGILFLTLTVPHYDGQRLAVVYDVVARGFQRLLSGRAWQAQRERYGVGGTIRAVEVTHGQNGWHPHVHALLFLRTALCDQARRSLEAELAERWGEFVQGEGLGVTNGHGCVLRRVTIGNGELFRYLTKVEGRNNERQGGSIGLEMTRHDLKAGRRKGRTPWGILAGAATLGDADDLRLWTEYETATKGRRALRWSRGLKAWFGTAEVTDDEIAAEEVGGEVLMVLPSFVWREVTKVRGAACALLSAAELDGSRGVFAQLRVLGIALGPPGVAAA